MSTTTQQELENSLGILEIDGSGKWPDVEKQYRQLIQQWHPDRHIEGNSKLAETKFIEINSAYKLIREHYRKNGAIPRVIPTNQGALLGKKQTPEPARQKSKGIMLAAIGFGVLILLTAVLWSLDARVAANNRDRAKAGKQLHQPTSAAEEARVKMVEQLSSMVDGESMSNNDVEP